MVIREERWVEPLFIRVEEGPAEVVQASGQGASLGRCLRHTSGKTFNMLEGPSRLFPSWRGNLGCDAGRAGGHGRDRAVCASFRSTTGPVTRI